MSPRCAVAAIAFFVGCGRLEAITNPGMATLSGCLFDGQGVAAAGVPVFVTTDSVASHETRTDPSGCFSLVTPVGQHMLVANDFRGHGLVEPVTLYAGQHLELGKRAARPLQFDTVLPTLRGVGAGERLGLRSHSSPLYDCDHQARRVTLSTGNERVELDAETGEVRTTALALSIRDHGRAADGWPHYTVVDAQGRLVEPPEGRWEWVVSAGSSFLGHNRTRTFFGTRSGLSEVSYPAHLLLDGSIIERRLDAGVIHLTRLSSDGEILHRDLPGEHLALGPTWAVSTSETGATTSAWRARLDDAQAPPDLLGTWPGTVAGSLGLDQLLLEHDGGMSWLTLDAHAGHAEAVPLPQWPGQLAPQPEGAPLVWVRPTRDGGSLEWQLTVSHLEGGQLASRQARLPSAVVPTYSFNNREDFEWWPGFSLVADRVGGLEAFVTDGALYLLAAGAPLVEARPVATLSLSNVPLCLVGNHLLVESTAPDRTSEILRYDARRIFDELGRAP